MFNRRLRSNFDLIKPDVRREVENKQYQKVYEKPARTTRQFQVGQPVLSRDYRSSDKLQPATVCERQGPLTYQVKVGESIIRHHADQLVDRPPAMEQTTTPKTLDACSQTEYGTTAVEDIMEDMDVMDPA